MRIGSPKMITERIKADTKEREVRTRQEEADETEKKDTLRKE